MYVSACTDFACICLFFCFFCNGKVTLQAVSIHQTVRKLSQLNGINLAKIPNTTQHEMYQTWMHSSLLQLCWRCCNFLFNMQTLTGFNERMKRHAAWSQAGQRISLSFFHHKHQVLNQPWVFLPYIINNLKMFVYFLVAWLFPYRHWRLSGGSLVMPAVPATFIFKWILMSLRQKFMEYTEPPWLSFIQQIAATVCGPLPE